MEAQNFDARKHLLEYDDVMNKQRETIYGIRRSALEGKDQREYRAGHRGRHRARTGGYLSARASSIPTSGMPRSFWPR